MRDAMRDAKCNICQEIHEPGINFENQVCHWIEGMKSLENDIKIIGIGATVWKWRTF